MMHATTNAAPGVEHTAFCNSRTWLVMHIRFSGCENYVLALVCQLPATTLVRETTRALGGGCSLHSFRFILPIDGAVTGALNFAACMRWYRHL